MRPHKLFAVLFAVITGVVLFATPAFAAGTFKMKSNEVTEVSGAWHIYVTIELAKPPLTAHQPMKFVFTKTAVYERSLVDGRNDPVLNVQTVNDPTPAVENLDVDFADPSGKIFKGTRFDFGLTRTRGFEAGEYQVELRTSDGTNIGAKQSLKLKGDNPVVDRRAIAFNAKDKAIKKVDAVDAGGNQAKNDDVAANNMQGDVTPTGTATGFVPKEGQQETEEEKIKTRPKGCGCEVPGGLDATAYLFLVPLAGLGAIAMRRRRSSVAAQ